MKGRIPFVSGNYVWSFYLREAPAVLLLRPRASDDRRSSSPTVPVWFPPQVGDVGLLQRVDAPRGWGLRAEAWVGLPVSVHGAGAVEGRGEGRCDGGGVGAWEGRVGRRWSGDRVPVKAVAAGQGRWGAGEGAGGRVLLPPPHVLCVGVWGSVNMAVRFGCCGRDGHLLGSRGLRALLLHVPPLLLSPHHMPLFSIAPPLLLSPVVLCLSFSQSRCWWCRAVDGVASLSVGAVQW